MKRKCLFLFLMVSFWYASFWVAVWTSKAEANAHFTPKYAKEELDDVLKKVDVLKEEAQKEDVPKGKLLTKEDYELLYLQTGMAAEGVDELIRQEREEILLFLQERFFADVEVECLRGNAFVRYERMAESLGDGTVEKQGIAENPGENFLPVVQNGDILISFSGHIFGWRYGHAAIVVDAERRLTVEAVDLGSKSKVRAMEHWAEYPGFVLLRATGVPIEQREEAAIYAVENLVGLPYSVFAFGGGEKPAQTHCAHLVWCAYEHCGFDLDGDGGMIVTPKDLLCSDLVEVVQVYGIQPGTTYSTWK